MKPCLSMFGLIALSLFAGCYYDEYQKATKLKEQAEQKAAEAQAALTAEQKAMNRLYTED